VRCVTAELQLQHHLGFALTDTDRHDLRQLAARFGIPVPPELGRKAAQAESRSANSSSGCRSPR
jgi:hypothetical protein